MNGIVSGYFWIEAEVLVDEALQDRLHVGAGSHYQVQGGVPGRCGEPTHGSIPV